MVKAWKCNPHKFENMMKEAWNNKKSIVRKNKTMIRISRNMWGKWWRPSDES